MFGSVFILLACLLDIAASIGDYSILEIGTTIGIVPRSTSKHYCVESPPIAYNDITLKSLLSKTVVTVSVTHSGDKFDWFDVSGISTDDFQLHLKRLGRYLLLATVPSLAQQLSQPSESDSLVNKNFIRDILSSCPSPISTEANSQSCDLSFSPFGKICVNIRGRPSKDRNIMLVTRTFISKELIIKLILGIGLLYLASVLSKSMMLQVWK